MTVGEFQIEISVLLSGRLNLPTDTEWRARMSVGLYSPRVDVAVGPYAIDEGVRLTDVHVDLFEENFDLFYLLCKCHLNNLGLLNDLIDNAKVDALVQEKMERLKWTNMNGRCFIAIEVENNVSRKHLMGGAINSSVLGKIGIAVGFNDEKHRAFLNLYRYFQYLQSVNKPTFNTSNLLIISKNQLLEILS